MELSRSSGENFETTRERQSNGGPVPFQDLAVLENLMAAGQMLAAQLPSATSWTPEKKLAAAVLASALVEIRDYGGVRKRRRKIAQDLDWVQSDEVEWPYSFLSLCALFDLEPEWVRAVVRRWAEHGPSTRPSTPYRQAA